ncbi:putative SigmaB asociated two-component system sensor protein [Cystobacter fuscus DSM 2262]|uniref:histidine kinase n=1 Tax=Cystobacter fuscus (strain ATCC 25194 / DSM 2262 / NBRC 100088 / M29) TaxID=1242864 RepID=S9P420_CYSF2|nr:ATP-binding protein [Cystobacter fuscus]EPX57921.1 putative SigmaB asociated two-component system sensor protein [Cystobacter fuscus DSM 2262]
MSLSLFQSELRTGQDVVNTRQRGRHIAQVLGFEGQDQVRIATAISEVARLAASQANGHIEFLLEESQSPALLVLVRAPSSTEGLVSGVPPAAPRPGPALAPAQRLMDRVSLRMEGEGWLVLELAHRLPRAAPPALVLQSLRSELERQRRSNAVDELSRQNEELLRTLEELHARKAEVDRLNRELEETNRGVVALYAELEEKAEALRRASDMKTRFISNVSHELRTPISSVVNLSRLLLDRLDGPLNDEQEKQVTFIRKSGEALQELIDDLLDLAKIESGRSEVLPTRFSVGELFGSLRGMLRPLKVNEGVALVFDEPKGLPELHTDERKLSQILRNLISNALKFTPRGEVRVSAAPGPRGTVEFSVSDTGVGIAPEDQERIFEEFVQVEGPHQQGVKGTGLGLPLSRRLAELLGGSLLVESQKGQGSTFRAWVALDYTQRQKPLGDDEPVEPEEPRDASRPRTVLLVDDDEVVRYLLKRLLADASLQFREATTGVEGVRLANQLHPSAIVLDLSLPGMDGFEVLETLRRERTTRDIPVIIHTSRSLTEQERGRLLPHVMGILSKSGLTRDAAFDLLQRALSGPERRS